MKKGIVLFITVVIALILVGCEPVDLMYKDKVYDKEDLAELIEDELELENRDIDLEVEIYVETEEE